MLVHRDPHFYLVLFRLYTCIICAVSVYLLNDKKMYYTNRRRGEYQNPGTGIGRAQGTDEIIFVRGARGAISAKCPIGSLGR